MWSGPKVGTDKARRAKYLRLDPHPRNSWYQSRICQGFSLSGGGVENDLPNMSNEKLVIHMPVASATITLFISQTAALGELCEHGAPMAG